MNKRFLFALLLGILIVLTSCQTSNLQTDEELNTEASTSWGADIGSKVWLDEG